MIYFFFYLILEFYRILSGREKWKKGEGGEGEGLVSAISGCRHERAGIVSGTATP